MPDYQILKKPPGNVYLMSRDERVLVGIVRSCYIGGRRRRPGERALVLRDEAQYALADRVVELLPDRMRTAAPEPPPTPREAA